VFYIKYFAKKLAVISYKFLFHNKIYKYFLKKKFKTKLTENMSFFSSDMFRKTLHLKERKNLCFLF